MPVHDPADAVLSGASLRCVRSDRALFDDLNVRVAAGQVLHVRGANGSGKTSLLRILSGLLEPDAGEVQWRGRPIRELGPEFAGQLIYIGHGNALKLDLTARENLEFMQQLAARDGAPATDAALAECGLADAGHVSVRRLSAGQRRRLSLARLLVCSTPLWLLDEPFTSLDEAGRILFTRLIREHAAGGGIAVIAGHGPMAAADNTLEITL